MRTPVKVRPPHFLAIALLVAALALPVAAQAWSQTYSNKTWFGPGGFNYSSWNANLNFNEIWWSSSVDRMQTESLQHERPVLRLRLRHRRLQDRLQDHRLR